MNQQIFNSISGASYSASYISGTMAAGLSAGSDIFQFRWADTSKICLINAIIIDGLGGSGTAFAAGFANVSAFVARAWSADGSGGTAVTLTGNNAKLRTKYPTTAVSAIRGASTGALTTGTRTLDSTPIGIAPFAVGTTASVNYLSKAYLLENVEDRDEPLILDASTAAEGIVIQATVPATGTWQFGVTVQWQEVNKLA